jgi:hypothetical protein
MVKVKGFPRALYSPDAAAQGRQPSVDGPDVVAYKRTVSRAGRWPWQAFDDAYSNGFAHGKAGGNVGDSGVAGVQRQQGIEATGWVGEVTFNTLRSIVVPEGLPHAGEMAMDATAAQLVDQAYDRFRPPSAGIDLGPMESGGKGVRAQDLTHATSGIPLYPAFDDVWYTGRDVLAPEALAVTRTGGASHGVAFYADGDSGLRWWFGHLNVAPAVGRRFARGAVIGSVAYDARAPHVHVGINVERLWGGGKQMTHRSDYTHGAPLVGAQLDAGHAL